MQAFKRNSSRKGFTLIEVLIVVGIIALLVMVLAIAILPMVAQSDERRTRTLLQTIAPVAEGHTLPNLETFRRDAGNLADRISSDNDIAHSQMMLFYLAPSNEVWQGSRLYAGQNYNPQFRPEEFSEYTRTDTGKLPYLVDAWDRPLRWQYDTAVSALFISSAGPDGEFGTNDDLVLDTRMNEVRTLEELR
jgi:prepilin-type N-terminal cleavage/methylation domain-containing protein